MSIINELTAKQRLMNTFKGAPIDRRAFSPFLAYYWDYLPQSVKEKGQFTYMQEMGADPLLRGFYNLTRIVYHNCEVSEKINGNKKYTIYETPVGKLTLGHSLSDEGNTWFLTEHAVENENDLKTLQFIYENMEVQENLAPFEDEYKKLGDNALIVPVIGAMGKTSFQNLVEHWCGTESLCYIEYDYPDELSELLSVMREVDKKTVEIAAKSSAEAYIFWEDSSTMNISPAMFEKYTRPIIDEWADILHENDKLLIHHACGHLKDILDLISGSKIDVLESVTPPPTGNTPLSLAWEKLRPDITIIGGLDPVFLLESSVEDVTAEARRLLDISKNRRYVLANADSCPPGVEYEKFLALANEVKIF